jgi:hypothetical protein
VSVYTGNGFQIYMNCGTSSSSGAADVSISIFNSADHTDLTGAINDVSSDTTSYVQETNLGASSQPSNEADGFALPMGTTDQYNALLTVRTAAGHTSFIQLWATGSPGTDGGSNGGTTCDAGTAVSAN